MTSFYIPPGFQGWCLSTQATREANRLQGILLQSQSLTNVIIADVTSSQASRVDFVEVEYKKSSESSWNSAGVGELGLFEIVGLEDDTYDIRARAINSLGVKGVYTTITGITIQGLAEPPSDVTGFRATVNGNSILLEWDAVSDGDLSYYVIRHASETSGATWPNSTILVEQVARPATSVTVSAREGTYLIKAVDKSNVKSTNAASVVVLEEQLPSYSTELTQAEAPTFTGTQDPVDSLLIEDGKLSIDDTSLTEWDDLSGNIDDFVGDWDDLGIGSDPIEAGDSADYYFSTYIDAGSSQLCRVSMDLEVSRRNNGDGLFDDLSGLLDTLEGDWDDLTENTTIADIDVTHYVSTTTDDPSGSPTWSDYTKFTAGDFYGRAFRFYTRLTTYSANITPEISLLTAKVQY